MNSTSDFSARGPSYSREQISNRRLSGPSFLDKGREAFLFLGFYPVSLVLILSLSLLSYCKAGHEPLADPLEIKSMGYEEVAVAVENPVEPAATILPLFASFQKDLASRLVQAMKTGGPVLAIEECKTASPAIESDYSQEARAIYRISDRPRNPEHNPDAFEAAVLDLWKGRLQEGQEIGPVSFETVDARYVMKPIVLNAAVCLQCHGLAENIKPETARAIASAYPQDRATGYSIGDLRGAFVARLQTQETMKQVAPEREAEQ